MSTEEKQRPSDRPAALSVHYNGSCPICRPEVEHYKRSAETSGVQNVSFVDITTDQDRLDALGISFDDAARRFTVVDGDGRVQQGVDAFIALWGALPRYRWLAAIIAFPPVKWLAEVAYDHVVAPLLYWSNRRAGRLPAAGSPSAP
jgi:predicted DCC family thiol-disulfide oxidoreductase YuxK